MQFNGKTLMTYGTFDTPWTEDFEEVSAKVDGQADAVEQNASNIAELQQEAEADRQQVEQLQQDVAGLHVSTMTSVLENAAATEHTFAPTDFDILLVGATPASGHHTVCATIPAATAAAGLEFQVTDEASYTKWNLSATGIVRADGTGTLTYIYGVKL